MPPNSPSNLYINECTDDLIVKRNLNNLQVFNENPLSTNAVQMQPEPTLSHNDSIKNNSRKYSEASKNGHVVENGPGVQILQTQYEREMQQRDLSRDSNFTDNEKCAHSSKKNKKSKKHHKLKDNLENYENNLEPNQVLRQHDDISMVNSDETVTPVIPKLIISRNKYQMGSAELNNFTVKESLKDNEHAREKNLKRRRSSEDSSIGDGKRKKSGHEASSVRTKRLSVRLEDGE